MKANRRTIPCTEVVRYFSERLGVPFRRVINRHLGGCPNCSAYLHSLKEIIQLYRAYPAPHPTDQIRRHLYRTLSSSYHNNER